MKKIYEFFKSVPYSKAKFLTVHLVKEIDISVKKFFNEVTYLKPVLRILDVYPGS